MTRFIAYYRVSTDKQGKSGLGLDGQHQAVGSFVAGRGEIIAEHTEIESTRNHDLLKRIDAAAKHRGISRSSWIQFTLSRALDQEEG